MILTNRQITEAYMGGDILIDPFDQTQVQGATYDLRVGEKGATTSTKKIVDIKADGYLLLQPGDFGVVTILEEIRLGPMLRCAIWPSFQVRAQRIDRHNRASDRSRLSWSVDYWRHEPHAKAGVSTLQRRFRLD